MDKQKIKKIVPAGIWASVRRRMIVRDQNRIAKICDGYIDEYFSGRFVAEKLIPKKNLEGKRIIWQYWAQGFDGEMPEVVKVCLQSVDKYKGGYEIIRLSDKTISEYVDLPSYVLEKVRNGFSVTAFSNVLRLALLYLYGGVWLDSTVLLTSPLEDKCDESGFFMFQRDESEKHKKYWENSYAYYFGWGNDFKVRVLTSIIFAEPRNKFIGDYYNLLTMVWQRNAEYPFYFTFQVLFNQLVDSKMSSQNCRIENDCLPHYLMQIINDDFPYSDVETTLSSVSMHKLTFKSMDVFRFRTVYNMINNGIKY